MCHPNPGGPLCYRWTGRYIPTIALAMLAEDIAVDGILIGNGEVDAAAAFSSYGHYTYNLGFVGEGQRDALITLGERCTQLIDQGALVEATLTCYTIRDKVAKWTDGVNG